MRSAGSNCASCGHPIRDDARLGVRLADPVQDDLEDELIRHEFATVNEAPGSHARWRAGRYRPARQLAARDIPPDQEAFVGREQVREPLGHTQIALDGAHRFGEPGAAQEVHVALGHARILQGLNGSLAGGPILKYSQDVEQRVEQAELSWRCLPNR
jgi:hypothetical protein